MKKAILILVLGFLVLFPSLVYSQGFRNANSVFEGVGEGAGADTYKNVQSVVGRGLNAALSLVGLIFLILIVYAGYLWMTARGEEEQIKKAQKIITSTIIGSVIVMSAWAITLFVLSRFEKADYGIDSSYTGDTFACYFINSEFTTPEACVGDWVDEKCLQSSAPCSSFTSSEKCSDSSSDFCTWSPLPTKI